jgi:acylphosphatase
MRRLEAAITGRVQGVGYRNFVWNKARELGLCGYVKNQVDGSVEAIAEGDEATLDDFLATLHRGPMLARVDNISTTLCHATGEFDSFEVRY